MTDGPQDGNGENFWSRLRRRKLVQWGLAYAAGAWGFQQGLAYLSTLLDWPAQLQKLTGLALLIGLPIALVLAWYHGDRGERRVTRSELAILTGLFLLGGGIFWRYQHATEAPELPSSPAASATISSAMAPTGAAAPGPDPKSIAVLPFVDMSPAKDQEYMSEGMAEELLNLLAKAPDLKVIARTSSFAFKGKDLDIAEIATKLNVANVLEGSVRKSGDTIRITAQLIRASDSTHLWSETFDRPLDDIFAIQDEIAGAIAEALQIQLTGGTVDRGEGGTRNLEAYQLYLRAWNGEDWNTESSLDTVSELLEQAIKLDPEFGLAWSALASVERIKVENGYVDATEGTGQARQLIQHALELSPRNAHAHVSLASIHLSYDWDWSAAASEIQKALALEPANPSVLVNAARLSLTLGRWGEAEQRLNAALDRDPLNSYAAYNLALVYYHSKRLGEAEATLRRLLEVAPGFPWTRGLLAAVLLEQGNPEEALVILQQDPDQAMQLTTLPIVLAAMGRQAEADEALHAQVTQWSDTGAYYVAQTHAYRRNPDLAFDWLERAYRQKDPTLIEIVGDPLFRNLHGDPRFNVFLRKMRLPETPWSAAQ